MTGYVVRRVFYMMITLALVSVVGFAIIQLPPGDFLTSHLRQLGITGTQLTEEELQDIRAYYGLDKARLHAVLHLGKQPAARRSRQVVFVPDPGRGADGRPRCPLPWWCRC